MTRHGIIVSDTNPALGERLVATGPDQFSLEIPLGYELKLLSERVSGLERRLILLEFESGLSLWARLKRWLKSRILDRWR